MAEERVMNKKGKALMDKLQKARADRMNKNAKSVKPSSGTFGSSDRMADAKKDRGVQRGKGDIIRRPDYSVKEFDKPKTSVTESKKPGTAVTEYKKPNTSLTKGAGKALAGASESAIARTAIRYFGPVGALVGMTEEANKGEQEWIRNQQAARKLRKAGAGTPTEAYDKKPAAKTFASKAPLKVAEGKGDAAGKVRAVVVTTEAVKATPKDKVKRQMQGQNPDRKKAETSKSSSAPKVARDKSRLATKKPSNFERAKMRSYEKEGGIGPGRAKSKVSGERKYKFRDIFK